MARALVVGASRGSDEPRHVADALLQYRMLRDRGLSDEEIVLALPAWASGPEGKRPVVRSEVGGPELLGGAEVDLPVEELEPSRISGYLDGGPGSLQSYVFLSGHGDRSGLELPGSRRLNGADLGSALTLLRDSRDGEVTMTAVIEDCLPDSFLDGLEDEPGAAVLTAAARGQSSFATEYDRELGTWLADQFTAAMTRIVVQDPPATAMELLARLGEDVPDSEPQLAGETGWSLAQLVPSH